MIIIIIFLVQGLLVTVTRADQWYQPSLARALSASQPLTVVEENYGYGSKGCWSLNVKLLPTGEQKQGKQVMREHQDRGIQTTILRNS